MKTRELGRTGTFVSQIGLGQRTLEQYQDSIGAVDLALSDEELRRLDTAGA